MALEGDSESVHSPGEQLLAKKTCWSQQPDFRFQSIVCVSSAPPPAQPRGCSAEPPNPRKTPQIQEKPLSRALSLENAGQPLLALEMVSVLRCRGRCAGGRCWGDGFRWEGWLLLQLCQLSLQWPEQIFGILHPSRFFLFVCSLGFL